MKTHFAARLRQHYQPAAPHRVPEWLRRVWL